MIHTKRIAAVLAVLLAAATVAGCNTKRKEQPKEKTETARGRYVEKNIAMPKAVEDRTEYVHKMIKNEEGKIEICSENFKNKENAKYLLKEDFTWVKENSINNKEKDKEEANKLKNFDKKLEKENVPYDVLDVLKDNRILIMYMDKITVYQDGNEKYSFKTGGYDYVLSNDKLMMANKKGDGVIIADLNTGEIISEIPSSGSIQESIFAADQKGNWYMVSNLGIQRLVNGGNRWETILDGSMAAMGMPSISPEEVFIGENGEFYIMYQGKNGRREIKYYFYDKNLPILRSKTLSVTSLYENKTVRQAIAEFQQKNQDVKVNYKTAEAQKQNSSITVSDYIKTVNTELLAGKGADIILLDDMSIDSYIEKGVLADLSEVINPMLEKKEVLGNIIEPYKTEGKIYAAPVRIGIPLAFGRKEAVKAVPSMQMLADYAKIKAKLPLLGESTYNYNELTSLMFSLYAQSFLGKNGELVKDELIRFLEYLKVISNQTKADSEQNMYWDVEQKLFDGQSELGIKNVYGMYDIYEPFAALDKTKGDLTSVNQKFIPKGFVGVNNASKDKKLAYAFVKQLYAEEVQVNYLGDGFPVNRKALEKFELEEDDFYCGGFRGFEATQPSLEKMQSILNLCKTLTTPVNNDKKLFDMITQESEAYLGGNADVTQTADKIIQRTKTYLAE